MALSKQKGSALVVVMLIFAIAFSLAVEIVYRQHHAQTRAANLVEWDNRYQMAIAAETLAIQGLIDDLEDDIGNNELADDCSQEKWKGPFSFPYEDVMVSASVQDLQGRFNVNWLVQWDANTNQFVRDNDGVTAFQNLLANILPPSHSTSAVALAGQMADWLDTDNLPNGPDGAEDDAYRYYRTANHPVISETEFRSMLSFDTALAAAIAEQQAILNAGTSQTAATAGAKPPSLPLWQYITALPSATQLNVNTAPEAVLEALFSAYGVQGAAAQVVADRSKEPYANSADVLASAAFNTLSTQQRSALSGRLATSTEYFQVMIDIQSEAGISRLVTRIKRSSSDPTEVFSRAVTPVLGVLEQACNPD